MKPFFPHNTTLPLCAHNRRRERHKRNTKDQFQYLLHTHSLSFNNVWSKQQILFLFQHQLGKFQHPIIISPRTDRDPRLAAFAVRKQRQRPLRVHREGRRHERTHVDGLRTKRQKVMSDSFNCVSLDDWTRGERIAIFTYTYTNIYN